MGMYIYHATLLKNLASIQQSGFLKRNILGFGEVSVVWHGDTPSLVPQPYGPIYDGVYFAESEEGARNFILWRNQSDDIAVIRIRKDILRKHYGSLFRRSYDHSQEFFPYKAYVVWDDVDLRKTKAKVGICEEIAA